VERHFEQDLAALKEELLAMAGHAEAAVQKSIRALERRDPALAAECIQEDDAIDRLEISIEERCLNLFALQQPLARDLRFITASLKITNDLERVGDHAVNIAECAIRLSSEPQLKPLVDIPRLEQISTAMLRGAIDAFIRRDPAAARQLVQRDDEVDALNRQVFRELMTYMIEDPKTISRALELIMVARSLERVADLATNIAEEVVFIAEARIIRHHAEEADFGRA
jgi:phosphate transport system protein